jgi:hypothetical protein
MPKPKPAKTSTLADAQDAARKIFHEAANPSPAVRRFYATKSKHFAVIQRLDPTCFADFLTWLFLLDGKACPDRWIAFGSNASDQLHAYCYPRLSESTDDSLARLMDAFRTREFRGHSSSDLLALLRSLIKRNSRHALSKHVLEDVVAFIDLHGPPYSRGAGVRQREVKNHREMKSLSRELVNASHPNGPRQGK